MFIINLFYYFFKLLADFSAPLFTPARFAILYYVNMTSGQFWQDVKKVAKTTDSAPVMVGEVVTLKPFVILFQGVEIGDSYGDTIYANNLLLDENINLDIASMDSAQNFTNSTAYQSPSFTAEVSGTQKQFLTDFYNWTKAIHERFILHEGDNIAIQRLGNNTYLILEKVQKIVE